MSFFSPVTVPHNSEGFELPVSQSQFVTGSHPGIVIAGSGSAGQAIFFKVSDDGALFVTGTLESQVTLPASQSVQPVAAATTVLSSALASTTAYQLLAANPNRKQTLLYVDGNASWFIGLGATPTTSLYTVQMNAGSFFELPERYTGTVEILSSKNGGSTLMVTDISY